MSQNEKLRSIYLQRLNIYSEVVAGSVAIGDGLIRRRDLFFSGKIIQPQ
jgi:hypothetical protein